MKLFCNLNKKTIIISDKQQKIINEMIAYHGSKANFDEFNIAYIGSGIGAQEFGEGLYLTFDKEAAYSYGGNVYTVDIPNENEGNYIYYDKPIPNELFTSIIDGIIEDMKLQYPNEYQDKQSIEDLRKELYDIMEPSEGRNLMYNIHRYIDDPIVIPNILKRAGVTGFIYNNGKVNNVIMFSSKDIKILDKETVNENKNSIEEEYFTPNELLTEDKKYYVNMDVKIKEDSRTAPKMTPSELEEEFKKIWDKYNKENQPYRLGRFVYNMLRYNNPSNSPYKILKEFYKDMSKVNVDSEDIDVIGDIRITKSGIPYVLCNKHGDWEDPVLFMAYFDGSKVRGYIPEYGNCYNSIEKRAFGDPSDEDDRAFIKSQYPDKTEDEIRTIQNNLHYNKDACIEDFEKHIKVNGKYKNKKSNVSENIDIINESLLLEANLDDIYTKYYSNIPQEEFWQIIKADPTYNEEKSQKMGKYGKWLLNLYKQGKLKNEDLYKATDYLSYFVKYYNKIVDKDINKLPDLSSLYNVIKPYKDAAENGEEMATSKSDEMRRIKQDAEKFYEDDTWLVVIPHSQEASCYYGKNTQWCTAATGSYNYFNRYYSQGLLYININKSTNKKYQFHFETDSFMDETDTPINSPIAKTIGLSSGLIQAYANKYGGKAIIALTCSIDWDADEPINGEDPFYSYVDYDGYAFIVRIDGINVVKCKNVSNYQLTSENEIEYLGNGLFKFNDYRADEVYDEDNDEYYKSGETIITHEVTIYNAKTQQRLELSEDATSIFKLNNSYFRYTENGYNYVVSSNDLKVYFKTKNSVQIKDCKYFIETFRYVNIGTKFNRYEDDIIILSAYVPKIGSIYKVFDIYNQNYIEPPFENYRLTVKDDEDGYRYITFDDYNNHYCYLLSDGSLSQVYEHK